MALARQARIQAKERLGCLPRILAAPELSQSRRAHRQNLEVIGIRIELLARPGQRSIVLAKQVVAERIERRPLIARIAVAALRSGRKQLDRAPMRADHEMAGTV